ncbi:type VI secretion system lipoprotein TssJ [Erwinia sp. E_sp_B04_7]|uniref:type VI secretion system lipoprotein TssJ n=1 Tax=unclassified Erwinia TaxID=2622719 RepID=UPI0030CB7261
MNRYSFLRLSLQALLLIAASLMAGCSSSSHRDTAHYDLVFQAHPQINDGAPLKVRVMLLKSDADFMSADFYSLQNSATTLLGSNLINNEQFFLMPGQLNKVLRGQSTSEARYIGILAEYQSLDGKKWRISLPLPVSRERHFYNFWQGSPDELKADIIADISGLRPVTE